MMHPSGKARLRRASLYLVADLGLVAPDDLPAVVAGAIEGGVDIVQIRAKKAGCAEMQEYVRRLLPVTRPAGVPLLANDLVEAVVPADADGVHVGQGDADARAARGTIGPDRILGVSARSPEQARKAQADGADYIGAGAIFLTSTKDDAEILDPAELARVVRSVSIPVFAIGGIHAGNVREIAAAGCRRIAVASAVLLANDPKEAARELKDALAEAVGGA